MCFRHNYCALYLIVLLFFLMEISVDSVQIRVENKGAFVTRVLIRYKDSNGQDQLLNSGTFPALQTALINMEDNTKSIDIEVQMFTFIGTSRTIFQTSSPCPHSRCFVVWGTVFKAEWNENCCQ